MNLRGTIATAFVSLLPLAGRGGIELLPAEPLPSVFTGRPQSIQVVFHNPDGHIAETNLRRQLFQASSATVIPLGGPKVWKTLQILPGQTVLENVSLTFPDIKTGTRFLVRWTDDKNRVLGTSDIMAYPTNLLDELKLLAGGKPVGVFDPQEEIKPSLTAVPVAWIDLAESGMDNFSGQLALIGPAGGEDDSRDNLVRQVSRLGKKGVAVVWFQDRAKTAPPAEPDAFIARPGKRAVVVAQSRLIARLAERPVSQLNLIRLAELAAMPETPGLPGWARSNY